LFFIKRIFFTFSRFSFQSVSHSATFCFYSLLLGAYPKPPRPPIFFLCACPPQAFYSPPHSFDPLFYNVVLVYLEPDRYITIDRGSGSLPPLVFFLPLFTLSSIPPQCAPGQCVRLTFLSALFFPPSPQFGLPPSCFSFFFFLF